MGACGISLSLERLATAMQGGADDEDTRPVEAATADVLVCSLGPRALQKDALTVARDLWAAGMRALLIDTVQVRVTCNCVVVGMNSILLFI